MLQSVVPCAGGSSRKDSSHGGQTCRVPKSFLQSCRMLKAYIALAELLAACTPMFLYPKLFVGASITSHVDSMTGASRSPELSHSSTAVHCLLSLLHASAWWEWVASSSNPADGGTRTGTQDNVAKTLGVEIQETDFPSLLFSDFGVRYAETLALFSFGLKNCGNKVPMGRYQWGAGRGQAVQAWRAQTAWTSLCPGPEHWYPHVEGHAGVGYPLVGDWSRGGCLTQPVPHSGGPWLKDSRVDFHTHPPSQTAFRII